METRSSVPGLRFSVYTLVSTRLESGGYALLNSVTGALDVVPDELGAALGAGWEGAQERTGAAAVFEPSRVQGLLERLQPDQVEEFRQRGYLTTLTVEEERQLAATIATATHDIQALDPQFMIVPNLDCNYRCTYCFERPLQNGLGRASAEISHARGNVVMTSEHVRAAYDAIEELRRQPGLRKAGQIVLYGGEPLEARNRSVVFEIVEEGCRRSFLFAVITNGHDLREFLPLLGRDRIAQVQISIDGPKQIHDRRRIHLLGESSFERILENVDLGLARTDAEFQLRVHVDPANIQYFEETLGIFGQHGWLDHPQVVIYANTVYAKDRHGNVRSRIDNAEIHARLRLLASPHRNVYTSAPAVHTERAFEHVFGLGERLQVKGTYCAANTGNYIFAPDGHIYACWESVGKACSRLGEYLPDGVRLDEAAVQKWFSRSVAKIPECLTCSFALVCGGGCAQYAEYNQGTPFKPYCDDFQDVFRSALAERVDGFIREAGGLEGVKDPQGGADGCQECSDQHGREGGVRGRQGALESRGSRAVGSQP